MQPAKFTNPLFKKPKEELKEGSRKVLKEELQQGIRQGLWHFAQSSGAVHNSYGAEYQDNVIDTGFSFLNESLAVGGWPTNTTSEIALQEPGVGELRLMLPALKSLINTQQKEVLWIAPPYQPHAHALLKEELDINRLTLVESHSLADVLWCAEQALKADCCAAVFIWTGKQALEQRASRRLQLAVERSHSWLVHFRHSECLRHASAAKLRLQLQASTTNKLQIKINKQPMAWGGQECAVSLSPYYEQWQRIDTQSLPVKSHQLNKRRAISSIRAISQIRAISVS